MMDAPPSRQGYLLSTLERLPALERGDVVHCDCGEAHTVYGSANLFLICRGAHRLAAVGGRCVLGVEPDAPTR